MTIKIIFLLCLILIFSGCIDTGVVVYGPRSGNGSNFSLNLLGFPDLTSEATLNCGVNMSCDQSGTTININSIESDPIAMANISANFVMWSTDSGGVINASICTDSPAQYSRWNGTGFECFNDVAGGGVTAHGDLTGLLNDDHPQYVLHSNTSYLKNYTVFNGTNISLEWFDNGSIWFDSIYINHNHSISQVTVDNNKDLMGYMIYNGTVNGTNFATCDTATKASVWNGTGFECKDKVSNITGTYPIIVTGGTTKTLSIEPEFNQIKVKEIRRNTTGDPAHQYEPLIDMGHQFLLFGIQSVPPYLEEITSSINISSNEINLTSENINLNGSVNINGINVEQELVKTSIKSFQADYINESAIRTDLILIPQDLKLTNLSIIIDKSVNATNFTLNISLEKFSSYPTLKDEVFNYSFNTSINYINSLNYDFSNNDILLLNYTTYRNVSRSSSLFKFKVR